MKKMKNMLLMSLLAICAVAIVGMDKVSAAEYDLTNPSIVCEPDTISAGQGTDCYLVGQPSPASGDVSVHGYLTYAYTTDYLELKGATKNKNITDTDALFLSAASATDGLKVTGNMPAGLEGFVCQYDSDNVESGMDFGCAIFYTVNGKNNAFTPTSITKGNDTSILPGGKNTYGVIGSYQVSVAANVEGEACGELCVKAWKVPGSTDYNYVKECATDGKKADGTSCTGVTSLQTVSTDSGYICREVHYQGGVNPDTGTFASYALLIAGALIAVAAVTLAKKNTKLYRV